VPQAKPRKAKKPRERQAEAAAAPEVLEALVLPEDEPAAAAPEVEPEDAPLVPLADADEEVPTRVEHIDLDEDGRPWTPPEPGQLRELLLELDADPGEEDE